MKNKGILGVINTTTENLISIMEKIPKVYNNHTNKLETITGLAEFENGELACCFNTGFYALHECVLYDDGLLHCCTWTIGGVLWGSHPDAQQLKKYNNETIFGNKIKCIHFADGTKVYPAI